MQIAIEFFKNRHAAWMRKAVLSFMGAMMAASLAGPAAAQVVLGAGPDLKVTDVDMQAAAELIPVSARAGLLARKENVEQQAQSIYLRRVLAAEAVKNGMDKDPLIAASLQVARERILSETQLAARDLAATPADAILESYAQAAYKADQKRFEQPAQFRARHILIRNDGPQAKARADAMLARIKAGASFEAIAKAESDDVETSASGGDLGFFAEGRMVKPFEDAVAGIKNPGELAGPVLTEFGYHLIKLEARRPAGALPYAEVREALRAEASGRVQREARTERLNQLLGQFKTDPAAVEAFAKQYTK